jgi:hypothetical protein
LGGEEAIFFQLAPPRSIEHPASPEPDKKLKLVNKLLSKSTPETGRRSGPTSSSAAAAGLDRNTLTSREGMQKYLRDSFARNKPYDRMVHELITATGVTARAEGSTAR